MINGLEDETLGVFGALRAANKNGQPGGGGEGVARVVHLDADAFFASVEQAADPRLRGKPVAVGGMSRGIVASASYEARRCGVYTPMPTSRALRVCPHLILLRGDYERYEQFSRFMFSFAYDFTPDVEIGSIDEGYFDLGSNRRVGVVEAAERIREAIRASLKIGVSEGIGANKLVAQIASKLRKPGGFVTVRAGEERGFLAPLPVRWLPGVGVKSEPVFRAAGLVRIAQVAEMQVEWLRMLAGSAAERMREHARGIDPRPVVSTPEAEKSFGAQETLESDTAEEALLERVVRGLVEKVVWRMRDQGKSARTISVKIRYADMVETERSASRDEPGDLPDDFTSTAWGLLKRAWERRARLRMVRVKLSHIYRAPAPPDLLTAREREKRNALENVVREVQGKYGSGALVRGWRIEERGGGQRTGADVRSAAQP